MAGQSALFDLSAVDADGVEATTSAAIEEADRLVDRAAAAADAPAAPTFESTLRPLDDALAVVSTAYGRGAFLARVSVDRAVRDAANAADERLAKWRAELPFRDDVARSVGAFAASDEAANLLRRTPAAAGTLAARLPPCRSGPAPGPARRAAPPERPPRGARGGLRAEHRRVP